MFSAICSGGMSAVPTGAWNVLRSLLRTVTVFLRVSMTGLGSAPGWIGLGILPRGASTIPKRLPTTGIKGASAMKAYYRQVEQLTNKITLEGKYTNIRKDAENLFGYYTDDVLNQLQTHLDKALAEIGKSDDAAAERVRLVATSLEYTKHARDLVLTGYQVRTGKKTEADFATAKASFVNYAKGLTMSWAVSPEHNYSLMRNSFTFKTQK